MHRCSKEPALADYRPRSRLRLPAHEVPRARFPAIDAHNHLGRWLHPDGDWAARELSGSRNDMDWAAPSVPELLRTMDECGVEAVVNLDGGWGAELRANLDRYDRAHPGRFHTFCQLDWSLLREPDGVPRLLRGLADSVAEGARGLKVWKTLGLHVRDGAGDLMLPDDECLADLWDAAGALGIPVLIHVADPSAFFDPADERNERLEILRAHPDWSYADSGFPRHERLLAALDTVLGRHPGTVFVGAHVASCADDLGLVDRMLDEHPNLRVDIGARIADLGRQPRAARRLLLRHPDRVLFGTDHFPPNRTEYARYFRFLETDDEQFPYSDDDPPGFGRWDISALDLPDEVLRAVYRDNALTLLTPKEKLS
ncbi:amidohydrolase family protein [Solihabitans fulvus]|uniref:Amidohydrolase family protein n=1 Tax=Solihabitans fulvus TaxID=1892852 RepID=A0A5B2XVU0_9PSEU|nr:amidohydrolase family protein [Solihabitans fulvus]KAA2267012.1 amidohydrolase family protein [Solihabitans fulvus]